MRGIGGGVAVNRIPKINSNPNDLDGLRLIALGRIPRCARCDLYRELLALHSNSGRVPSRLPDPPADCMHRVCAPLAIRLSRSQEYPVTGLRAVNGL